MTIHTVVCHKGKPHEKMITVDLPDHMSGDEYQQRAMRTICPQGDVVLARLQQDPVFWTTLLHAVIGMMGELGEICTAIQSAVWYNKGPIDKVNLQEEFGDAGWYGAEGLTAVWPTSMSLSSTQAKNLLKLIARYPEKFTEFLAAEENRDRGGERTILEQMIRASATSSLGYTTGEISDALIKLKTRYGEENKKDNHTTSENSLKLTGAIELARLLRGDS